MYREGQRHRERYSAGMGTKPLIIAAAALLLGLSLLGCQRFKEHTYVEEYWEENIPDPNATNLSRKPNDSKGLP